MRLFGDYPNGMNRARFLLVRFRMPVLLSLAFHAVLLTSWNGAYLPEANRLGVLRATVAPSAESLPLLNTKSPTRREAAPESTVPSMRSPRVATSRGTADPAQSSSGNSGAQSFATTPTAGAHDENGLDVRSDGGAEGHAARQYRLALAREAARFRRYPIEAQVQRWQGTVTLSVTLEAAGEPAVGVETSSGYPALDAEGVSVLRRAVANASVPMDLRGGSYRVSVPLRFSLDD